MACNSCQQKKNLLSKTVTVGRNLAKAASSQPNVVTWFKDGVSGLIKCFNHETKYTDEEIRKNRDVCRACPYSTKVGGDLNGTSQCMAPDPQNNNAPCACFILCKTQSGDCPINAWVHLTVDKKGI